MALASIKVKKFEVPKTQLKRNDRKERVTIFPMTQMARQTELWNERYLQ